MKKILLFLLLLQSAVLSADLKETPQSRYINKYAETAVKEMYRSGVPASITLAQGIIESRSGLSALAAKSNNHFGIKCHGWTGRKVYYDDDRPNECFRAYDSPEESFKDHSDFLRYNDRYKFLFDLPVTDYKSWAYGLKKAGYATDPTYAVKLISYIEQYDLSRFDVMSGKQVKELTRNKKEAHETEIKKQKKEKKSLFGFFKSKKNRQKPTKVQEQKETIPASPLKLEEPKHWKPKANETLLFDMSREILEKNGVPYVVAVDGDSYKEIALSFDLFEEEIYEYNDADASTLLLPGDYVYIKPKKEYTVQGLDLYIVNETGEKLRDIAQRFAVRLNSLCKLNNLDKNSVLEEGDVIKLR